MRIQSLTGLSLLALGCVLLASCAASSVDPSAPVGAPSISQVAPLTGAVGASVTLSGSGFASANNTVKFGTGYIRNLDSSDGTTLRFTVPDGLDLCAPDAAGPCPGAYPPVTPGDYPLAVMSRGETSNRVMFTVTP